MVIDWSVDMIEYWVQVDAVLIVYVICHVNTAGHSDKNVLLFLAKAGVMRLQLKR